MRLIDADALLRDIEKYHLSDGMFQHWVDVQPTVEAIPIEMIQREIENWDRKKPQSYHAICYRHLIEDWRRENEDKRSE